MSDQPCPKCGGTGRRTVRVWHGSDAGGDEQSTSTGPCSACNGTGRKPEPTAAERAAAFWANRPPSGTPAHIVDQIAAAIREAEAAAFRRGAEAMRRMAEKTARDNYCGSDACEAVQHVAGLIAALPVPEDRP
jgi:hypothetical protein